MRTESLAHVVGLSAHVRTGETGGVGTGTYWSISFALIGIDESSLPTATTLRQTDRGGGGEDARKNNRYPAATRQMPMPTTAATHDLRQQSVERCFTAPIL